MPRTPEIVPLSDAHADAAARLLAERQTRLRADLAALPSRAWTGLGFVCTRVRLERVIDPRVAWAQGA